MKRSIEGKRLKNFLVKVVAVVTVMMFTGCATFIGRTEWPITVQSDPTGAKCVVSDENGEQLHSGDTPMALTLSGRKGFFVYATYNIYCWKEGYFPATVDLSASLNDWYWGNIFFGGLVGMLIVDPMTGAMWELRDPQVVNLARITGENVSLER